MRMSKYPTEQLHLCAKHFLGASSLYSGGSEVERQAQGHCEQAVLTPGPSPALLAASGSQTVIFPCRGTLRASEIRTRHESASPAVSLKSHMEHPRATPLILAHDSGLAASPDPRTPSRGPAAVLFTNVPELLLNHCLYRKPPLTPQSDSGHCAGHSRGVPHNFKTLCGPGIIGLFCLPARARAATSSRTPRLSGKEGEQLCFIEGCRAASPMPQGPLCLLAFARPVLPARLMRECPSSHVAGVGLETDGRGFCAKSVTYFHVLPLENQSVKVSD